MVFNIVKWGRTARLAMIFVFTLTALIFPQSSFAHTEAEAAEAKAKAEAQAQKEDIALQDFGGLNFGLGVGVVVTPSTRLVGNAQVVNGIVRAEDQSQATGSILLESHYFFNEKEHPTWAQGPFVGIKPGGQDSQIIDTIALGWMFGFRRAKDSESSWNIGIAGTLTPAARVLGDGITNNQPLPAGETEARTKTTSLGGFMVIVSFAWNSFK